MVGAETEAAQTAWRNQCCTLCSCRFLTAISADLVFLPWYPRVDLGMSREKQERGEAALGLRSPLSSSPASPAGVSKWRNLQTSLMTEGSESKYYNLTGFLGPGGAAQAARHILGPKTKTKKKCYQQNLKLMKRTMPENSEALWRCWDYWLFLLYLPVI